MCWSLTCCLCRLKAAAKLSEGLAPRDSDAPPTFLDFDFVAATSETDEVKMTVSANDRDDDDDDDDDDVRRHHQHQQQDVCSAAVDIGSAAVHS